jgi:DNA ligase 1
MKAFAQLIFILGTTTKTNEKLLALQNYFAVANDKDKVWVIALFTGRRPKRTISSTLLKIWCAEKINIPLWLFDECYHTVGDLSETIALLIEDNLEAPEHNKPLHFYIEWFLQSAKLSEEAKKSFMLQSWATLNTVNERFVFNKLLSGAFRIGVSQQLLIQALAKVTNLEASVIAHRISGKWDASTITFDELLFTQDAIADASKPYPFYLAYPLEALPQSLGEPNEWLAEWKWDGIRGQLIKRNDTAFVWSRGEELVTEKFPEYETLFNALPNGIALDGEIIPAIEDKPLPFAQLQTRIGRKNITKKILQDVPVCFFVYDILEFNGEDIRTKPLAERRTLLESIVTNINNERIQLSPIIHFNTWEQLTEIRKESRAQLAEGIMLKRKSSAYQTGRKRGDWWKWKIDPLVIDAVMIYAQKGSGRRSNLYTDYTFAVKDGDKLVPFAKAYSGLTDKEIAQVDAFVKRNAVEKFGPVRTVKPELVFELAFEGIAASTRHKSGVALRFPRISRWRTDKKVDEINTLEDLKGMLEVFGGHKN